MGAEVLPPPPSSRSCGALRRLRPLSRPPAGLCSGKLNSALSFYTSSTGSWGASPLNLAPAFPCFGFAIVTFKTNLIPWPRKWQFFEGNPPLLIQLVLKLISTPGLSPTAFEVNNSVVLLLKWSRFGHAPGRERLRQVFQRAVCGFVPRELHPAPNEGVDFGRTRP